MPRHFAYPQRLHTLSRLILIALVLPCVYFGGAGAAFYYRQRIRNAAASDIPLPVMPAPTSATRLMVFAPHCDDEVLGCGGLIQQTTNAGGAVRAVILTNGDGFRTAVERQARDVRVGPSDYIQFATLRQQESQRAIQRLGQMRESVLFLGYPDGGLMSLWNAHWLPTHPYTSPYTRCYHSPYANTFDAKSVYCGRDLIEDIKSAMRAFQPTLVTVTHPAEDHADHAAAAAFVMRALQELQDDPQEASWASRTQIRHYLVHRGDWPTPQGRRLTARLAPPVEMMHLDTRWQTLPLARAQTLRKADSIEQYSSQTALMRRFLESFARRGELFGEITPARLPVVPDHTMLVDAGRGDWEKLTPVLLDPVRDNVLRDLQGGGDIRSLYMCRDHRNLYLRLDTRQPLSSRMTYQITLRPFARDGHTPDVAPTFAFRPTEAGMLENGVRFAVRSNMLEAVIPLRLLTQGLTGDMTTLAASADTLLASIVVDKTGVRFLTL